MFCVYACGLPSLCRYVKEAGEVGQDVGWSFGPLDGLNLGEPKRTRRSMPLGDQMGCLAQSFASRLGVSSDLGGSYVAR